MIQALNLPSFNCDVRGEGDHVTIFDIIRKKHVVLTPEEWVRQNFVHYLINHYHYPKSLIKNEGGHSYNRLRKRTDILVYNRAATPFMLVECKAASVKIDQKVFQQASVYNKSIRAKYLVITNGLKHFCCEINHSDSSYKFINGLPVFT